MSTGLPSDIRILSEVCGALDGVHWLALGHQNPSRIQAQTKQGPRRAVIGLKLFLWGSGGLESVFKSS